MFFKLKKNKRELYFLYIFSGGGCGHKAMFYGKIKGHMFTLKFRKF